VQYLIGAGTDGSGHQHPNSGVQLQGLRTLVDILKILWKYLWKNNISLQNSQQVLPKLQLEGNFFIMERLILSGGLMAD
jgi:hypothetical protein